MAMRFIVLTCVLGALVPQSVSALTPAPSGEPGTEPSKVAVDLQSAPELMHCSVDRAPGFWQNTATLPADVPCQYVDRVGGDQPPSSADLQPLSATIQVESSDTALYEIKQPFEPFAPPQTYGQLFGPAAPNSHSVP